MYKRVRCMQIATSLFIKPISGCVFITMDHDISPIFRDKNVRCAVALYSVYSFAVVGEHEMYSLWSASGKDLGNYLLLKHSLLIIVRFYVF